MTSHDNVTDIVERIAPLLEELETGQDCAEYAYAKGKGFQAMTYCPEAFEALKELPQYIATLRKQLENARSEAERRDKNEARNCLNWGPCSRHDEPMSDAIQNLSAYGAISRIAGIKADDGDDFSDYDDNTIIRCEITAGDLKAIRALKGQP